ncbi:MAG: hypothetical protein AAFP89_05495 [Bacteroidota bacterium]
MKRPDPLHELIQTLSMSEKRYFKIFAQRHTMGEENKYVSLFDAICEMEIFDQEVLKEKLTEEGLSIGFLSADKNYLYQLLLKSLSGFHASKTNSLKVKETLHQIEILYEKGLYPQCLALIQKGQKIADQYDLYPVYLELSNWERKVLIQQSRTDEVKAALSSAADRLALLDNVNAFMQLYYRMYALRQEIPKARNPEDREQFDDLIAHPFLEDERIALSFQAKLHFWRIHALYHLATDHPEKELQAYRQLLELMDSSKDYAQEFPYDYVSIYGRILTLKQNASDEEFLQTLDFLQRFPERIKKSRRNVNFRAQSDAMRISLQRLIYLGRFQEAVKTHGQREGFIKKNRSMYTSEEYVQIQYLMAYTWIGAGEYRKALPIINSVINETHDKVAPDYQAFARVLNMVIHYELQNYTLMKYAGDMAIRLLQRRKRLSPSLKAIFRMFKKLARFEGQSAGEIIGTLKETKQTLILLYEDPYEAQFLQIFDILSWIDSKVKNISLQTARQQHI